MRKVTFGGANSLDNFFARKDDAVDWLLWDKEVNQIMKTYWKTIDTVIMGRRTYEVAARMGGGGEQPGVKTFVLSRTLKNSQYHLAVAGGYEVRPRLDQRRLSFAPTRYREVVLTVRPHD